MSNANNVTDISSMLTAGGLAGMLGADASRPIHSYVSIADIKVMPQHRGSDAMEDSEQTLEELCEDIKAQGVLQPIILCTNTTGGPEEFRLIAGERRMRSSIMAGKADISSMVYGELTEEQIDRIQFSENVLRLNLRQIEEAKVLQKDLEELGTAEAVAKKRKKSPAWVSKRLALLSLSPEAARLLTENISGDLEVIGGVAQIEKIDAGAAAKVVDTLKEQRGEKGGNARKTMQQVKDEVKPPKKPRAEKEPSRNPENVALPKDKSHELPGPVVSREPGDVAGDSPFEAAGEGAALLKAEEQGGLSLQENGQEAASAAPSAAVAPQFNHAPALPPAQALEKAYTAISKDGQSAKKVLEQMPQVERDDCQEWLKNFYELGTEVPAKNLGRSVALGMTNGEFAQTGHGLYALVAYLTGTEEGALFNLQDILASVKPDGNSAK